MASEIAGVERAYENSLRGLMFSTMLRWSERNRNSNSPAPSDKQRRAKGPCLHSAQEQEKHSKAQTRIQDASLFSKLPDVLVVDILSRLPPKSFFRCKCVSKSWLSLSSDAVRLNKHLEPTMRGFFYNHVYGAGFVNLSCVININKVEVDGTMSFLSCHDQYLEILDCCNRLLLVKASNKKSPFSHDIHVYNPVTQTLFTLCSYKQRDHKLLYDVFSLVFDHRVFHQFHVIRFTGKKNPTFNFLDIFSFERGECRINYESKGTFVDGRVY